MKRIAVIGGGWAGIAAAVYLIQKGFSVSLFEAGKNLGGRAKTLPQLKESRAPVWSLDNGQHLLLGAYWQTFQLMKIIKSAPEKVLYELPLQLETPHLLFEYQAPFWHSFLPTILVKPWQNLQFFKQAKGFNAVEKQNALHWLLHLKKNNAPDISVDEWLKNYFSEESLFLHEFLKPLCIAALNTPTHRSSAAIFHQVLCDSLLSYSPKALRFWIARKGLSQVVPEPAKSYLAQKGAQLFFSTRIFKIEQTPAQTWILHYKNGPMHVDFDSIVLAMPADATYQLLKTTQLEHLINPTDCEPVATLYVTFERSVRLKGLHYLNWPFPAFVIPQDENGVAIVLSASGKWQIAWKKSTETLTLQFKRSLEKRQNAPLGNILFSKALCIQKAAWRAAPNLKRKSAGRTSTPGIYLAGDHTILHYPSTLESAVLSGKIAAEHIAEDFPR